MGAFLTEIKHHYRFSQRETKELLISVVLVAFMFAFDDKSETLNITHWLINYFNTFLLVTLSFLVALSAQKIWGIAVGYRVRYKVWSYGLVFGVAVAILSQGKIIIPLPGGVSFSMIPRLRLGGFRYGFKNELIGWISGLGPLTNIFLAMFTTFFFGQVLGLDSAIFDRLVFINFMIAFFLLLPLPPLPGLTLFYGNRLFYVIVFGFIFSYALLYSIGIYSLFIALLLAIVIWVTYYLLIERGLE